MKRVVFAALASLLCLGLAWASPGYREVREQEALLAYFQKQETERQRGTLFSLAASRETEVAERWLSRNAARSEGLRYELYRATWDARVLFLCCRDGAQEQWNRYLNKEEGILWQGYGQQPASAKRMEFIGSFTVELSADEIPQRETDETFFSFIKEYLTQMHAQPPEDGLAEDSWVAYVNAGEHYAVVLKPKVEDPMTLHWSTYDWSCISWDPYRYDFLPDYRSEGGYQCEGVIHYAPERFAETLQKLCADVARADAFLRIPQ